MLKSAIFKHVDQGRIDFKAKTYRQHGQIYLRTQGYENDGGKSKTVGNLQIEDMSAADQLSILGKFFSTTPH